MDPLTPRQESPPDPSGSWRFPASGIFLRRGSKADRRLVAALNELAGQHLASVSFLFAALFALRAFEYLLPGGFDSFTVLLHTGAGLGFLATALVVSSRAPVGRWAHPTGFAISVAAFAVLALDAGFAEKRGSVPVMLLTLIAGSMMFLQWRWFFAFLGVGTLASFAAEWSTLSSGQWRVPLLSFVGVALAMITIQRRRRQTLEKLAIFRMRDRERKRLLQEQIEHASKSSAQWAELSVRDPLTGAYNRRYLDHMQLELERPTAFWGAILLDLDSFKAVNDRFGHEEGDRVLQAVAHFVRRLGRAEDRLVRLGGDEFLLIVDVPSQGELQRIAGRVVEMGKKEAPIGFSLGYAYRGPGEKLRDVLQRADAQMYERKSKSGRGNALESIMEWRNRRGGTPA